MKTKYQIFISYRRDGGESLARLLEDKLEDRGFSVFLDVEALRSGNFNEALLDKIAECTDVLVVLPPNALDRCSDPQDWVRLEIAHALKLNKNIIPILMRNFTFPKKLPEDIAGLEKQNGITANSEFFDAVIEKLVSFLSCKPLNGIMSDKQLREEAENGNVQAMNELGLRLEYGTDDLNVNQREAFSFYLRAAETGDPGALYNLADIYEQCEKDLTLIYDFGIDENGISQDAEKARCQMRQAAVEYYTKASQTGFLPAVFRLANLAEEDHNFSDALRLYSSAAEEGYPPAQNALGYYKMNGIMTKPDPQKALSLYKQAADAGYAPAVFNYARAMELQDIEEATALYRKVAFGETAIPQAVFSLAKLYERHFHDLYTAVTYYRLAVEAGIQEAEKDLKRCQDELFARKQ